MFFVLSAPDIKIEGASLRLEYKEPRYYIETLSSTLKHLLDALGNTLLAEQDTTRVITNVASMTIELSAIVRALSSDRDDAPTLLAKLIRDSDWWNNHVDEPLRTVASLSKQIPELRSAAQWADSALNLSAQRHTI